LSSAPTASFWELMKTHFQLDPTVNHPVFGRLNDLFERVWKEQGYLLVEKETQAKARLMEASQAEGVRASRHRLLFCINVIYFASLIYFPFRLPLSLNDPHFLLRFLFSENQVQDWTARSPRSSLQASVEIHFAGAFKFQLFSSFFNLQIF
jgi:hypothetical protein